MIAISFPPSFDQEKLGSLIDGLAAEAGANRLVLLGGDTTRSDILTVTITLFGEAVAEKVKSRASAKVGDALYLSGLIGESAAGLRFLTGLRSELSESERALVERHLIPPNRIGLSHFLTDNFTLNAMTDLSDGLAAGLQELAQASKLGMQCEYQALPLAATLLHNFQPSEIEQFLLYGGEDYELLFTGPGGQAEELIRQTKAIHGVDIRCIGEVKERSFGVQLLKNGELSPLDGFGFEHFNL